MDVKEYRDAMSKIAEGTVEILNAIPKENHHSRLDIYETLRLQLTNSPFLFDVPPEENEPKGDRYKWGTELSERIFKECFS